MAANTPCRGADQLQTSWFKYACLPCYESSIRLVFTHSTVLNQHTNVRSIPLGSRVTNVSVPPLNMTPRSPTQQHQRSTTISRRLRYRADQNLSAQPPVIPRSRNVRPRRAATLPEPHHDLSYPRHQPSQQHLANWQHEDLVRGTQTSDNSRSLRISALHRPVNLPLAPNLDFTPHDSPHDSSPSLVPTEPQTPQGYQHTPYSAPDFLAVQLPVVSSSISFEVPLSTPDSQQPHSPFLELQDMR
jgi:hypothetical protein